MFNFSSLGLGIYRASAPSADDIEKLKLDIDLKKIISLDGADGDKISNACKRLDIKQVIIPIDIKSKTSALNLFNHDFNELFLGDRPVLIHCHAGKDRTGLACAIIRCKYFKWSCSKAIKEALEFRFGLGVSPGVIKTYIDIICEFCPYKHEHVSATSSEGDVNDIFSIVDNERADEIDESPYIGLEPKVNYDGEARDFQQYYQPYTATTYISRSIDDDSNTPLFGLFSPTNNDGIDYI